MEFVLSSLYVLPITYKLVICTCYLAWYFSSPPASIYLTLFYSCPILNYVKVCYRDYIIKITPMAQISHANRVVLLILSFSPNYGKQLLHREENIFDIL